MGFAEGNWASVVILGGPSGREDATRDLFDVQPGLGGDQRWCDLRLTKENPFVSPVEVWTFFLVVVLRTFGVGTQKKKRSFSRLFDREGRSTERDLGPCLKASVMRGDAACFSQSQ